MTDGQFIAARDIINKINETKLFLQTLTEHGGFDLSINLKFDGVSGAGSELDIDEIRSKDEPKKIIKSLIEEYIKDLEKRFEFI